MGPWGALAGAVMGAIKHKENMRAYQEEKRAASTQTRYSPWTKMGAGQVSASGPSATKSIVGGAWSGFSGGLGGGDITDAFKKNKDMKAAEAPAQAGQSEYDMIANANQPYQAPRPMMQSRAI